MNKSILPPWLAAIAIITYRGAKNGNAANNPVPHFTLPADYVGAFFVFGALSLMSGELEQVAQITASPAIINDPALLAKFQEAQTALTSSLSRLLVVVEKYPDLKASQNFLALQTQLEGTENRITVERKRFNEAAMGFNAFRRQFPNVFVANVAGFQSKAYFQANQDAKSAPQVKF